MADDVSPRHSAPPNPRGSFTPVPKPGPDGQIPLLAFARRHRKPVDDTALEVRIATEDPGVTRSDIQRFYERQAKVALQRQRRIGGRHCQD